MHACVRQTPPLRRPLFSHLLASPVGSDDSNLNEPLFLSRSLSPSQIDITEKKRFTLLGVPSCALNGKSHQ